MRVFKFVIPADDSRLLPSRRWFVSGCLAIAIAKDVAEAKATLKTDAATHGEDAEWLDVADVHDFDLATVPVAVAWAYN